MSEITHQTEIVEKETCDNCGGTGEVWTLRVSDINRSGLDRCSACKGQGFTVEVRQLPLKTGLEVREEGSNESQK